MVALPLSAAPLARIGGYEGNQMAAGCQWPARCRYCDARAHGAGSARRTHGRRRGRSGPAARSVAGRRGARALPITGSAHVGGASHPWALVVKVCAAADGADPGAWDYPAREGLAYGSGLLAALPGGLAAPRCLAVETQPDGTSWLWLEAVTDAHPGPWPLERYARVARQLGRFNGAYLTGVPLPDQPWLSRGWLRDFVEPSGPALTELERLAGPGSSSAARAALSAARHHRAAPPVGGAGALPHRPGPAAANLLPPRRLPPQPADRAGPEGEQLVAVDWAYAGHGAVGEELVAAGAGQPLLL